jgi:hypothetical protein
MTTWTGLKAAIESTPNVTIEFMLSTNFDCSDRSSEITISTGNVTVFGSGTICADGNWRFRGSFFSVLSGAQLTLDAMTLKNGYGHGSHTLSEMRLKHGTKLSCLGCATAGRETGMYSYLRIGSLGGAIFVDSGATCNIDGCNFLSNSGTHVSQKETITHHKTSKFP